jgi:cytochrome oxidase Cu insertion factor (SCO1/SenC/PrrC family)
MTVKSVFLSLAVILVLSLIAGCANTATTPVPEVPAAIPTEETVDIEETNTDSPRTGDVAPDFTLPDSNGNMVHLADELKDSRMVILVFYHAHF